MKLLAARWARTKRDGSAVGAGADLAILEEEEDKKESPHVTFRCPPDIYERLARAVTATGWSRSKLVVRLLRYGLDVLEGELAASGKKLKK